MSIPYVIRKHGAFYRPNRAGYTHHIEAAGIYTKEEAEAELVHANGNRDPVSITIHPLFEFRDQLAANIARAQEKLDRIDGREASKAYGDRILTDYTSTEVMVYIDDVIHLRFPRRPFVGVHTYQSSVTKEWYIELIFEEPINIRVSYDHIEKFKAVLRGLNAMLALQDIPPSKPRLVMLGRDEISTE